MIELLPRRINPSSKLGGTLWKEPTQIVEVQPTLCTLCPASFTKLSITSLSKTTFTMSPADSKILSSGPLVREATSNSSDSTAAQLLASAMKPLAH